MSESTRTVDGSRKPTEAEVADFIGRQNAARWAELTRFMAVNYPGTSSSWARPGAARVTLCARTQHTEALVARLLGKDAAALQDKRLLGGFPVFASLESWRAWLTFLSALYGLPLSAEEQQRFCKHTERSRYSPPEGGYKEAAVITGVQSGKSCIASTIVAYEGLIATPQADGTNLYAAVLAQDLRGAQRTIFSYARSMRRRHSVAVW